MFDPQVSRGHRVPSWFQAPGPRSGRLGRAKQGTIITVVVGAFLVSLVAAAAGRPPALIPASGAERFVGPDGHRTVLIKAGPADTRAAQVRQTGHQPGSRAWVDGPWWFFHGLPDVDFANKHYWVIETEDDSEGETPQLLRLDETGLVTQVAGWPEIRSFDPARPEVPADPRAGQRITTTGHTRTLPEAGGVTAAYTSVLEVDDAASVGPDCLEFRRTDTIGEAAPVVSSRVRCPGRGVVLLELPTGRWTAAPGWPHWDDPRATVNLVEPEPAPLRGLVPQPIAFRRGELPAVVVAGGPLLSTGGSYVLAAQATGNLLWLTPGDGGFEVGAWVDAGGDLAGIGECGDVIAAATSQRSVVAHDDRGRWLWTTRLADVAGSDPVRAGDSLLVATKDGRLTALDCRTGTLRWAVDGVGSTVSPAVGPAGVLVAGESGVRLLDPATGQQQWERALPEPPLALGFLGPFAVAADGGNLVHALSGPDGHPVWTQQVPATVAEVHDLGTVIAVRTRTGFVGIDAHGGRTWQHDFDAFDSVSDGRAVFAADLAGMVVIDAAGDTVERASAPLHVASGSVYLARTSAGVTAADAMGTLIDWRRR